MLLEKQSLTFILQSKHIYCSVYILALQTSGKKKTFIMWHYVPLPPDFGGAVVLKKAAQL